MTTLSIIPVSGHAELLDLYPGQQKPRPCYVQLDLATGRMSAEIDPEIGNAVPMGVWHGLVRRYHLPGPPVAAVANAVMADMADMAQTVLDHAQVTWAGDNNVVRTHSRACEMERAMWKCDCPIAVAERAIEAVADGIHEDGLIEWYTADDWYADSVDGVDEYVARVRAGEDHYEFFDEVVADMEKQIQEIDESIVVFHIDRYLERAVAHALQDEEQEQLRA